MNISKLLLPVALLLTANAANADQDLKYGIQTSFGFGGDTFIDDDTVKITTLDAGDNFSFGAYALKPELVYDLSGKIALNYISGSEDFTDASEDFNTLSIDLLLMKEIIDTVHIGVGLTYHVNPSYDLNYELTTTSTATGSLVSTVSNESEKIDYDGALGLILEITKTFRNGLEVGISYTSIEYSGTENNNNSNVINISDTVNASNFALTAGFSF